MALGKNVIGRAILELATEDKDLAAGLDKAEGKTKDWGDKVGGIAKTAVLGLAGIAVGIAVASVKAAADAQAITAQTEAVLTSTKGVAGMTKQAVLDLADQLAQVIPVEDDVIQQTENMLLTFTNIGKDVFPEATETALNMSIALGTDAVGASVQLGKALNDPIAGIGSLTKVGVTFTDAQKAAIKTMVDSGNIMGAQKIILGELGTEFGNSGRAAGDTFSGKLKIAQTMLGNVQEEIGAALIPILMELLKAVMPAIKAFGEWLPVAMATAKQFMDENKETISGVMEVIGNLASLILPALGVAFRLIITPIQAASEIIRAVISIAQGAASAIGNLISAIGRLPGVQGVIGAFQGIGHVLGFAAGGIVPGPVGAPQLAVVHGGETVIPAGGYGSDRPIVITLDGQVLARVVGNRQQQRSFLAGGALG